MRPRIEPTTRYSLAILLGTAGTLKALDTTGSSEVLLPVAELGAAIALLLRMAVAFVSSMVVVLAIGGIVMALTTDAPCGCLGTYIVVDRSGHLMLASATGALAYLTLIGTSRKRSRATTPDRPDRTG